MKKLLGIVVLGLLWCNVSYSQNCSHIDSKKSKDEFVQCIKVEYKKTGGFFKKLMKWLFEDDTEKTNNMFLSYSWENTGIDFECFNLCKNAVKGTFTMDELNSFCRIQCPFK